MHNGSSLVSNDHLNKKLYFWNNLFLSDGSMVPLVFYFFFYPSIFMARHLLEAILFVRIRLCVRTRYFYCISFVSINDIFQTNLFSRYTKTAVLSCRKKKNNSIRSFRILYAAGMAQKKIIILCWPWVQASR